jgi:hypothetical protein
VEAETETEAEAKSVMGVIAATAFESSVMQAYRDAFGTVLSLADLRKVNREHHLYGDTPVLVASSATSGALESRSLYFNEFISLFVILCVALFY